MASREPGVGRTPQPPTERISMDQDDFYTDDTRNARVRVIRHPAALRPGTYPAPVRAYPPAVYSPAPMYQPAVYPGYAPAPMQAPVIVQRSTRFADLTNGEVIALAAQAFAALQSLPASPAPVGDVETDVSNLIAYQSALATHAKRDEQLRTVGALVAKLLA